ncbi:carboxypeptidase-like regulatory domain-containing protein [Mucilaginibacter humi]|uniref:carboxypeptidase-like regulatory domain-containing protein n=1 Tax=Mucilaginibacter humi TaxID=2732510 RepID=UPI001FE55E6A|nr:carboxypeptidase-like regulatory domain-containing protein [Mucilaginibacter humi]
MLMLTASVSLAQKASIKGVVVDSLSGEPMEHATVAVVNAKDTSLISYTVTQKNGAFLLSGLPTNIGTKLIISAMAYNTLRRYLILNQAKQRVWAGWGLMPKILTKWWLRQNERLSS